MTIEEKRALLVDNQEKLSSINTKVETEKRSITKEEQAEFDKILNESDSLRAEIVEDEKRAAKMSGIKEYLAKPTSKPVTQDIKPETTTSEYRDIGEWFVREGRFSSKIEDERAMSMGAAGSGGVFVPDQFVNTLLSLPGEAQIVRPRATVIGAGGEYPDAKVTLPVFNQFGTNGVHGGLDMQWIDEGGTKADTTPEYTSVDLEPNELGGSTIITDKLLRNAPVVKVLLEALYRQKIVNESEYQFLRGNGVGAPIGVVGCAGEKTVTRNTASQVLFADVRSMLSVLIASSWGSAVWVANQSILPYLINLVDGAGNTLFIQGDATKGIPMSLFGLPLVITGKTPTLGNKGDLMLCDFSYYLIKDGSGPFIASSEHVYFTTNKTVVKAFTNVDGAPWVKSTLLLEDGTTTVSPFVVLV